MEETLDDEDEDDDGPMEESMEEGKDEDNDDVDGGLEFIEMQIEGAKSSFKRQLAELDTITGHPSAGGETASRKSPRLKGKRGKRF